MKERRPPVTLEEVAAAIENLQAKGEKVTFRNVRRITGGSNGTLGPYIKACTELQQDVDAKPDIDDTFLNMMRKGVRRLIDEATSSLIKQRESFRKLFDDAVETINFLESEMALAEEKHLKEVEELSSKNLSLEKKVFVAEHRIEDLESQVDKANKKKAALERKVERLKLEKAAEKTRADIFEEQAKERQ